MGDKVTLVAADNLVEKCTVQAEHKGSVGEGRDPAVEESRSAENKESPADGGMVFLVVE